MQSLVQMSISLVVAEDGASTEAIASTNKNSNQEKDVKEMIICCC